MKGERYLSFLKFEGLIKQPRSRCQRSETPVGAHLQIYYYNIFATNLRLSVIFETECFLERVGCHQLFGGTYGFDHSFSYD